MLQVVHSIRRDGSLVDIFVELGAMHLIFRNAGKNLSIDWKLVTFPENFIKAAREASKPLRLGTITFGVRPCNGIHYDGQFECDTDQDLAQLKFREPEKSVEFQIVLRRHEISNLVVAIESYLTC